MKTPVIQVENVTKNFKNLTAVNGVDLSVAAGEAVAILGPNGAGKTTLVEMVEGLQNPSVGRVRLFGLPWRGNETALRGRLGICLQETTLMEKVTCLEILDLFGSFQGLGRDRSEEVLSQIGLEAKRDVGTEKLSGGQRQRLAIGLALLHKPELLMLDEPSTGLDPNARRDVWKLVDTAKKEGATLILTTHYMEEAEQLCDRIIMMSQGKIIADGSMAVLGRKHRKLIERQSKKRSAKTRAWTLDDLYVALTGISLND
jgi:ABC-2 type transport system ATP-binding protein